MKRKCTTTFFLCLSSIFLVFGIAGLYGSIFGYAWWVDDLNDGYNIGKFEHGILRYRYKYINGSTDQGFVKNLFKFKVEQKGVINGQQRDVILLCFIVSAMFATFAIVPVIFGMCRMKESSWEFYTLTTAFLTAMSAIPSIGSMVYIELKYRDVWGKTMERKNSWSYMLAWIGAGSMFLSTVFSYVLLCLRPRKRYKVKAASKPKKSSFANRNRAFEQDSPDKPIKVIAVKKSGKHVTLESSA